jgi:hypothetical protein
VFTNFSKYGGFKGNHELINTGDGDKKTSVSTCVKGNGFWPYKILFCSVLFCCVVVCCPIVGSVLFFFVLFYSVLFCSISVSVVFSDVLFPFCSRCALSVWLMVWVAYGARDEQNCYSHSDWEWQGGRSGGRSARQIAKGRIERRAQRALGKPL